MLTPALVRRILEEEEIPARRRSGPPELTAAIPRYGGFIGRAIEHHHTLERGMDRARELIGLAERQGSAVASGTVIVADTLSGGRGRFRRYWHAPPGGLWLTLILANTLLPAFSRLAPLAVGVACCETLRQYGVASHIRWVNDIHVRNRKIAGILMETEIGPMHGEEFLLAGIGVNVNNDSFPAELRQLATAVQTELGEAVELELFGARLLAKLAWNFGLLLHAEQLHLAAGPEECEGGRLLLDRWQQLSDTVGRRVNFGFNVQTGPWYEARVQGIDAEGGLILALDNGSKTVEYSGEVRYLE